MKKCIKCNIEKQIDAFYNSKSHKDGKMNTCKICFNLLSSSNKEYRKKYNNPNQKEYNKKYMKDWYKNNPEYNKEYNIKNKDKINVYYKEKKANDPSYKLISSIRTRISQTLSGYSKSSSTLNILGLNTFNEFKIYLESKFQPNMNWSNYGFGENKWVIDHIIPISSAKNEKEIYKLNHYNNLQPMWWRDNMIKGKKE